MRELFAVIGMCIIAPIHMMLILMMSIFGIQGHND